MEDFTMVTHTLFFTGKRIQIQTFVYILIRDKPQYFGGGERQFPKKIPNSKNC